MKNYYEILEVNETASQEVIERVYKLLAKKYHPDMNLDNPKESEEKFKEVTTAYETLSNPDKRKKYDEELAYERKQKENSSYNEAQAYTTYSNNIVYDEPSYDTEHQQSTSNKQDIKQQKKNIEQMAKQQAKEQARQEYEAQRAYNDAYYKALEDMGYTIVYKKTFKDYLRIILTIIVMAIVLFGIWQIPSVQKSMIEAYENSGMLKNIIDSIIEHFSSKS